MDQDILKSEKRELRRDAGTAIARMSAAEQTECSTRAQKRLLETPQFARSRVLLLYHSLPGEVGTSDLISRSVSSGRLVALPRTYPGTHTMEAVQVHDPASDLFSGPHGAKEPREGLPVIAPADIDLIVVPGRAFDMHGHRLGRGAGYYDRYLKGFPGVSMALAFDCQILDSIPAQEHDMPVQIIVTESRFIVCG